MMLFLLLSMLLSVQPALAAETCTAREPQTKAGLLLAESRWAAALENRDADARACRLAPEFVDTDRRGRAVSAQETLVAPSQSS